MKLLATPLFITLVCAQPLFAATNPWLGTWKLNRDKSTFTGDTLTVGKLPNNGYHFDYGALKYDVYEDGKDYPVVTDATISLKHTGNNEWLYVRKFKGTETSRGEMKLSDDGKTLVVKITGTRADGSTYKSEETNTRLDASTGVSGTWKAVKESTSAESTMLLSDAGSGKIKAEYPQAKSTIVMTFDGKPVTSSGPRTTADETSTFTRVSPTEFKYTELLKGKPYVSGIETVSADGKVLKDVNWLVSKPAEKFIAIWERQ